MSLETLINDGSITEVEITREELTKILLAGVDMVNDPTNHVTGVGYALDEFGKPSIRINIGTIGYDDIEVKLK